MSSELSSFYFHILVNKICQQNQSSQVVVVDVVVDDVGLDTDVEEGMDEVVDVNVVEVDNVFVVDVVVDFVVSYSCIVVDAVPVDDITVVFVCAIVEFGKIAVLVSTTVIFEVDDDMKL